MNTNPRCRFYIVSSQKGTHPIPLKNADQNNLIIQRPSKWLVFLKSFLCYIFRGCPIGYGFVRLPIDQADQLFANEKIGVISKKKVLVNGDTYFIESWDFLNLCIFCLEGILFGTFWKFWNWRF